MIGWLDTRRWWLVGASTAAYAATLVGLYVLMHSGFGERASASECWSGEWLVDTVIALMVASLVLSVLAAAAVARVWRRQGLVWRVAATVAVAVTGLAVWWSLFWSWSFDAACGL